MFVPVNLGARGNDHVLWHPQAAQTSMRPLRAADGRFIALAYDDHEVHVAVFGGRAPGVRTEQPDLLWLKFCDEPLRGRRQQIVVERFHGLFPAQRRKD